MDTAKEGMRLVASDVLASLVELEERIGGDAGPMNVLMSIEFPTPEYASLLGDPMDALAALRYSLRVRREDGRWEVSMASRKAALYWATRALAADLIADVEQCEGDESLEGRVMLASDITAVAIAQALSDNITGHHDGGVRP